MTTNPRRRAPDLIRRAGAPACLLALSVMMMHASPAGAQGLVSQAEGCEAQSLSKPFMPWVDPANYTPHPGGGFEKGEAGLAEWSLENGARVVDGNEPFQVRGEDDDSSLALPAGSRATTVSICVGLGHPSMRFFARRTSGSLLSPLIVEVLFEDAGGTVRRLPIGLVAGSGRWAPSLPLPVIANLLPLLPDERTAIAFRFTALGGDWQIDNLHVDPWRAR